MGSAAVRIRHVVERGKRGLKVFTKRRRSHAPGYDNVHRELAASAGRGGWRDPEWRNKKARQTDFRPKTFILFSYSPKKPGMSDNSVVQSAH